MVVARRDCVGRLERLVCSRVSASLSASLRSSVQDRAHLVGARLALVGDLLRVERLARLARARICGSLIVADPLVDEAPEGGDALVLHAVLGRVLRLVEDALEVVACLLVGRRGTCGRS